MTKRDFDEIFVLDEKNNKSRPVFIYFLHLAPNK